MVGRAPIQARGLRFKSLHVRVSHTYPGWSDIGYNFLVDRFGRCWVGRAGGAARLVRGSHTLGFNAESAGIAAIGNYDTQHPSSALLEAIAAIAAWKLDPFDVSPAGEVQVQSEGSDKFSRGRAVVLPVIDGHRDTNDTACPGRYLYAALPQVRARAEQILASAAPSGTITVEQAAVLSGLAQVGSTLSVAPGLFQPPDASVGYQWLRDARPKRRARRQSYVIRPQDIGSVISCEVTISRPGFAPALQLLSTPGPVMAEPTLTLEVKAGPGRARVHVTVAAPAGARVLPTGTVKVGLGKRSATVTLVDGQAVARFGRRYPLPAGTYPVRVVYTGDAAFSSGRHEASVDIT